MINVHGPIRYEIDKYWCDSSGVYLEGWIQHHQGKIDCLRLQTGETTLEITALLTRDIPTAGSDGGTSFGDYGFRAYLPWCTSDGLYLSVLAMNRNWSLPVKLPPGYLRSPPWSHMQSAPPQLDVFGRQEMDSAFRAIIDEGNAPGQIVCEVGSRNVSPGATTKRTLFPQAKRYIGVDIHEADNVDVVGDAHFLHDLFGASSVDTVFSIAVMEHLLYPWLFAAAVNQVLRPSGLTFHMTHQSWPIHEQPNDFWRFSDSALRVLFGPALGFEIPKVGMYNRSFLYPEERRESLVMLPLATCYSHGFVLARKVKDIDPASVRWPASHENSSSQSRLYPGPWENIRE